MKTKQKFVIVIFLLLIITVFVPIATSAQSDKSFVIQIIKDTGQLIKSYEVTNESKVRETYPDERVQVIMIDEKEYTKIIKLYEKHNKDVIFSYDEEKGKISHRFKK